jgi:hypothetical protein
VVLRTAWVLLTVASKIAEVGAMEAINNQPAVHGYPQTTCTTWSQCGM